MVLLRLSAVFYFLRDVAGTKKIQNLGVNHKTLAEGYMKSKNHLNKD